MTSWSAILNPDGSSSDHGYLYPHPVGWDELPAPLRGLEGSVRFEDPDSPTGERWHIYKGSSAWNAWVNQYAPGRRMPARPSLPGLGTGRRISVNPGSVVVPSRSITVDDDAETGKDDPVTEYTNDPHLGVVPVGIPTNQTLMRRVWNAPARAAAKVLPAGSVSEGVALTMMIMPWVIWGAIAWWIWKKVVR